MNYNNVELKIYLLGDNMVKYCKSCGSPLEDGSVFCDECGTKVDGSSSAGNALFASYNIDMMDSEEVIRHSQIHEGCLIVPGIVIGFGIFIGLISFFRMMFGYVYMAPALAFFSFFNVITIIGIVWLVVRYIAYSSNDLILTNKRVFGKCGLISTTQMQSPLNRIDSVSFTNGIIGKIIGYGTVRIATASTTFKFRFIREGETLYNDIFSQLEASEVEARNMDAKAIVDAMAEKLD